VHDWRENMDFNSMAYDVLQFMDSNNIDKAELIGHSIGGKVAQYVCVQILLHLKCFLFRMK
jgi:pimeloyl-ACP methyl ester carboxylesterase